MTLTEFLLARIAEDETQFRTSDTDGTSGDMNADYIEVLRERLLAECEAKRRIVHALGGFFGLDKFSAGLVDFTLKTLAAPYADHPDYREEWKP